MINVMDLMSIIFYIGLIILVIALIVLVFKAMKTLNKVDRTLDDINEKSSKLDGLFHIIDSTTDVVVGLSDRSVSFVAGTIESIINRKRGTKNE